MSSSLRRHLPTLLWAAAVAALLLVPRDPDRTLDGRWLLLLAPWADKLAHGGLFFLLAVLLARSFAALPGLPGRHPLLLALLAASLYGLALELLQPPLSARTRDPLDAVANAVGAGLGVLFRWGRG